MKLIPTILCGGAGSRLWPVSREQHPKPFIQLEDGQSLLQKAFLHGTALPNVDNTLIVTNREIFFKIENELRTVNTHKLNTSYLLEPFGRNTAGAIAAAALHIAETTDENAIMLVLPADHLITKSAQFAEAVTKAVSFAKQGKMVVFGISPTLPETAYGYIEADGNTVLRFVEKPDAHTAESYVSSGRYLWNSGMFCFTVQTILQELKTHCPEILSAVDTCMKQSTVSHITNALRVDIDADTFANVLDESIDFALMEKSKNIAVVPCDIGWSDIGSWRALSELSKTDENGNSIEGNAFVFDTQNCHIQSRERVVGAVGVKDLIIIDTPDAMLVVNRNATQNVKHLYSALKAKGHEAHKLHRTVHRPWGSYTILEEGMGFKIKRIEVKPGASLSLQQHKHRSEHWVVVSGIAKVTRNEDIFLMNVNESTFIPAGNRHRLENPETEPLIIIEVQTGNYLGEDDIVRFEDKYGRDQVQYSVS